MALMMWFFFANLFDPRKGAAIELIDTQKRIGDGSLRNAATPAAPPTDAF